MDVTTPRLWIRDVVPTDLEAMVDMWTDEAVARFMDDWGPRTREAVPAWIEATMTANETVPRSSHNCAIVVVDSGEVAGWIGGGGSPRPIADWDFGYALRPGFRGRGYAREALVGLLAFCFEELGLGSVWGNCHGDNDRSAGVMLGVGMGEIELSPEGNRQFRTECGSWSPPTGLAPLRLTRSEPRQSLTSPVKGAGP